MISYNGVWANLCARRLFGQVAAKHQHKTGSSIDQGLVYIFYLYKNEFFLWCLHYYVIFGGAV